jgi:hypothetical protein
MSKEEIFVEGKGVLSHYGEHIGPGVLKYPCHQADIIVILHIDPVVS